MCQCTSTTGATRGLCTPPQRCTACRRQRARARSEDLAPFIRAEAKGVPNADLVHHFHPSTAHLDEKCGLAKRPTIRVIAVVILRMFRLFTLSFHRRVTYLFPFQRERAPSVTQRAKFLTWQTRRPSAPLASETSCSSAEGVKPIPAKSLTQTTPTASMLGFHAQRSPPSAAITPVHLPLAPRIVDSVLLLTHRVHRDVHLARRVARPSQTGTVGRGRNAKTLAVRRPRITGARSSASCLARQAKWRRAQAQGAGHKAQGGTTRVVDSAGCVI